jgi:SAM-dependent methyltransferase
VTPQPDLAAHPDRIRWNARYTGGFQPSFRPHPVAEQALSLPLPDGPMLDLASGPSGSALAAATAGRDVTAVDVSEVALGLLGTEAAARGLAALITLVQADLAGWRPPASYALVLCTGYWDRAVFEAAAAAVAPGGLLGWEALTLSAGQRRTGLSGSWCVRPGEPASLLPGGFTVLGQHDTADGSKRRLLARHD